LDQARDADELRQTNLTVMNVALGAGGAAIVSGLLWYLVSPRGSASRVSASATVTHDGAMLRIGGTL
jgi:hypothetical protein